MALLSASQFDNPMMFGAVAPKTAEMLVEAGQELTKRIETQNNQFEAQMKAPQMGQLYADALTRVAKGDTSGFSAMAKASSMAAGNPFLQNMFKDAESVAARLFDSYMDKEALTTRLQASEEAATKRMEHQETMQTDRDNAIATRQDKQIEAMNNRQDKQIAEARAREDDLLHRQAMADWERDKATLDGAYRKEVDKIEKANAGENRRAEIDPTYTPNIQAVPQPPQYPPQPQRPQRAPAQAATGANPMLGLPARDPNIQEDGALFGEGAQLQGNQSMDAVIGAPKQEGQGDIMDTPAPELNGGNTPAPQPTEEKAPPVPPPGKAIVNDSVPVDTSKPRPPAVRDNKVLEAPLGIMSWNIKTDGAKGMAVSETVDTATGQVTYKINGAKEDEGKKAVELAETIGQLNAMDYDFAKAVSYGLMKGQKITVKQLDKKEDIWQAQVDGKPLQMPNPAFQKDPNQPQTVDAPNISADAAKLWIKGQGLITSLKDKISMTFHPPKEAVDQARAADIQDIIAGKYKLTEVNEGRKKAGARPITEDEIRGKNAGSYEPDKQAETRLMNLYEREVAEPNQKIALLQRDYQRALLAGNTVEAQAKREEMKELLDKRDKRLDWFRKNRPESLEQFRKEVDPRYPRLQFSQRT